MFLCGRSHHTVDIIVMTQRQQTLNLAVGHRPMLQIQPDKVVTDMCRMTHIKRDVVPQTAYTSTPALPEFLQRLAFSHVLFLFPETFRAYSKPSFFFKTRFLPYAML
jgi:hypothetical protein